MLAVLTSRPAPLAAATLAARPAPLAAATLATCPARLAPVFGPRFAGGLLREPYYSVQEQLILLCLLLLRDVLSCGRAGQASFQAEV